MQAHYSTASILAYITQSNKRNQKTEQVHVWIATHSARLTSTAGFTVWVKRISITVIITQNNGYDSNSNIL